MHLIVPVLNFFGHNKKKINQASIEMFVEFVTENEEKKLNKVVACTVSALEG